MSSSRNAVSHRSPARLASAATAVALLVGMAPALAADRKAPWDSEIVGMVARTAVQEGGRVKPLDTLAGFKMLKIRGKRSLTTPGGETLTPVPWLLDCLFFPEDAKQQSLFLVQNDEVLTAIGVEHETKKKRDVYTYAELLPAKEKLFEQARSLSQKEDKERTPLEGQIMDLAHNLHDFEQLTQFMDFARVEYPLRASPGLSRLFAAPEDNGLAAVLRKSRLVVGLIELVEQSDQLSADKKEAERKGLQTLLAVVEEQGHRASSLALFPPGVPVAEQTEWMSPSDLLFMGFRSQTPVGPQTELLAKLEQLEKAKQDPAKFKTTLGELTRGLRDLAEARGEYSKIPLEVTLYKLDFTYNALYLYVLAFLLVAVTWLVPGSRALEKGVLGSLGIASAFLFVGIVLRCIIRGRPPVTTLYETILFITLVSVVVCGIIEAINRQKLALGVSTVLGMLGMFLATKYEFKESVTAGDTMPSLVAVLDTNFWLATHVTAVTTGYSAGLLASAIAHVWVLGKLFGLRAGDDTFYRNVSRTTYGVLCFGLLFSVVGTILGGIWANYSWGRFWGWDPKENGALLICIWELMILHARLGGYIRDHGLCLMAILGGIVIAFSWWGVNLLGVGLHSYGFTSGIFQILVGFYAVEGLLVVVSLGHAWLQRKIEAAVAAAKGPAAAQG